MPAEKLLYALRDVKATVENVPLITASIKSKNLAEGSSALLHDVKCGHGAFMKSEADARELARLMVAIGTHAGIRTEAFITDMDAPLGRSVGNAVEIIECIEILKGRGPDDIASLVVTLASRLLVLSGRYTEADAEPAARRALESGEALKKLRAMVAWQGGDVGVIDDYDRLPRAARRRAVVASGDGFVSALHAGLVGRASMALGAGRRRIEDRVDHGAGILIAKKPGEKVRAGDTILELLYNDEHGLDEAVELAQTAIQIAVEPPTVRPLVLGVVT